MKLSSFPKTIVITFFLTLSFIQLKSQSPCIWNEKNKELQFSLSEISGVMSFVAKNGKPMYPNFSKVMHKPSGTMLSPDADRMKGVGMLNFFRVLIEGGYLTELRVEEPILEPEKDGISMTWMPTIRRQAKVKVKFTFKEPNIIDMDMWVETLTNYPGFEILLSGYMAKGFESGAYVAKQEFGTTEPEQIRILDQPMIHGIWPFFPRDEAGANLLTDGRHQKGRFYWRMAVGRRYGMPVAFFSNKGVDAILMGRPEDVYAVGATYKGEATDNVADHRAFYLSLFGDDLKAGEGRRTQMRMIIGNYESNAEKHAALYKAFIDEVSVNQRSFYINPVGK